MQFTSEVSADVFANEQKNKKKEHPKSPLKRPII